MKGFSLFFCLLFTFLSSAVYAHPGSEGVATVEANTKDIPEHTEEYTLPYPGILPDNPLYPVKAFRDRLVGFLISDPIKKTEFNILQADKRLQSGVSLIDNNKNYKLAIDTISKGENYLEEALSKLSEAKKQGKDVDSLTDRLKSSVNKHKEIIAMLAKKSPKNYSSGFNILKKRADEIGRNVEAFST